MVTIVKTTAVNITPQKPLTPIDCLSTTKIVAMIKIVASKVFQLIKSYDTLLILVSVFAFCIITGKATVISLLAPGLSAGVYHIVKRVINLIHLQNLKNESISNKEALKQAIKDNNSKLIYKLMDEVDEQGLEECVSYAYALKINTDIAKVLKTRLELFWRF